MAPLNPNAAEFIPKAQELMAWQYSQDNEQYDEDWSSGMLDDDLLEENLTPEELEEIEAAEEWVQIMASLEELERDHLIEVALRHAPKEKLEAVRSRAGFRKTHPSLHRSVLKSRAT